MKQNLAVNGRIKRGDIVYVKKSTIPQTDSEQHNDRLAVVVSNEWGNINAPVVTIAYLTCQPKADLTTHTRIHSTARPSTVLCEQINTVAKTRLVKHPSSVTAEEMARIDVCLAVAIDLQNAASVSHYYKKKIANLEQQLKEQTSTIQTIAQLCKTFATKMAQVLEYGQEKIN